MWETGEEVIKLNERITNTATNITTTNTRPV